MEHLTLLVVQPVARHDGGESYPIAIGRDSYIFNAKQQRRARLMWVLFVLAFVASMLLAGRMARDRHRSTKAWVWIAAFVGPLGALALYVLGNRPIGASHA
jgi:ABC-type iron transport system FetAB permease component